MTAVLTAIDRDRVFRAFMFKYIVRLHDETNVDLKKVA
jgi:hypothetical protein